MGHANCMSSGESVDYVLVSDAVSQNQKNGILNPTFLVLTDDIASSSSSVRISWAQSTMMFDDSKMDETPAGLAELLYTAKSVPELRDRYVTIFF